MRELQQIKNTTQKIMSFKHIDMLTLLNEKEKHSVFYPVLILEMAAYHRYDAEKTKELAEIAQLLFYSLEIHETLLQKESQKTLSVLCGDYLYSQAFKKITKSSFLNDVTIFTDFIKDFSERRIFFLENEVSEEDVIAYKYKQLSLIVASIISGKNQETTAIAGELSRLYTIYINREEYFDKEKKEFLDKKKEMLSPQLYKMVEKIAAAIGDPDYE